MALQEDLQTVAAMAEELRRVGVASVKVGDIEFTLREADPPPPAEEKRQPEEPKGVLDNHDTWGLPAGSQLPGLPRPR